jgi:hypothetical protein
VPTIYEAQAEGLLMARAIAQEFPGPFRPFAPPFSEAALDLRESQESGLQEAAIECAIAMAVCYRSDQEFDATVVLAGITELFEFGSVGLVVRIFAGVARLILPDVERLGAVLNYARLAQQGRLACQVDSDDEEFDLDLLQKVDKLDARIPPPGLPRGRAPPAQSHAQGERCQTPP